MSLSSEQDLLNSYLLRDTIIELLTSAEKMMARMQEQDGYYKGYAAGVKFSKEKVEQMFEEFKAKEWSDGMDEVALEHAKTEYEMQV